MKCPRCNKKWKACRCRMVWHCSACGRSGTRYSIEAHAKECQVQPQLAYSDQPVTQ